MSLSLVCPYFIISAHADNITIAVEKDTSLIKLIEAKGYSLKDDRVEEFLRAFVALNDGVKSISTIPKGSTVILPADQLVKKKTDTKGLTVAKEKALIEPHGVVVKDSLVEEQSGKSASGHPASAPPLAICDKTTNQKDIATFKDREAAEKFMEETGKLGFKLYMCRYLTEENRSLYRVLLAGNNTMTEHAGHPAERSFNEGLPQQAPDGIKMNEGAVSADIFEKNTKFYHPFVSMTAFFSDNILNTGKARKSDYFAVISPGIWLEVPHGKKTLTLLDSSTRFPGGYTVEMFEQDWYRHFNASLYYQADIDLFSRHSSENTVSHRLEGEAKYKFKGGLSLAANDQYLSSHDVRGTSSSEGLDKYRSNLFDLVASYNTGRKTLIRVGYSNFIVDYSAPRNAFRDRVDNGFSGAFFYKTGSKTSLFGEYQLINISYESNSRSDSKEQLFWLGLNWDVTARTKGIVKAGYGSKRFASEAGRRGEFIIEGNVEHNLTPRMTLILKAWRKTNESDSSAFRYMISNSMSAGLTRQITPKLSGYMNLVYARNSYKDNLQAGADENERRDRYYSLGLGAQYKFQKWLSSEAGYIYYNRNSNNSDFSYSSNVFYFKSSLSL
ncbi:MAG: outer membrane beta-barrel protein [Thermodesulfovibrionales bacterium]